PDEWMLAVAKEMNHSETAFLLREGWGWRLRWFTPAVEVELCGHATLASAHVMREEGLVRDGAEIEFATLSGELRAIATDGAVAMDFPLTPVAECPAPAELADLLGVK